MSTARELDAVSGTPPVPGSEHAAWADLPRVRLAEEPIDPHLSERMSYRAALREGWVPWHRDGDLLTVATAVDPSPAAAGLARELYGVDHVSFVATTSEELWQALAHVHRELLLFESQERLATRTPAASARSGLTRWQRYLPAALVAGLGAALAVAPLTTVVTLMTVANVVFAASMIFKTVASLLQPVGAWRRTRAELAELQARTEQGLAPRWRERIADADLPVYTVLVPVYREANIIAKLLTNIGALDYPVDRLDVMVLLEADDEDTIATARSMDPPPHVRLVIVPPGSPQTKPRACNYGLALARGQYAVIFDAEDRPEPGQLRTAVAAFARDRLEQEHGLTQRPPLAVAQASLHYFNADYNVLTRMFAIEYAHWFEAMLPGMELARMPMPLGGTSNHFDVAILRQIGGWDPYNVTEDADAGLRVSVGGYRVAVIASTTGEEACAEVPAWIRQRTRWIKGYMITAAVNTRHPLRFARLVGVRGVIGMVGLIVATPLAFLSYPFSVLFTALAFGGVELGATPLPGWVMTTSVLTFLIGITTMVVSSGIAATSRYSWRIGIFAVFGPLYWLLHSVAAWRAFHQVLFDPHRWEKTPHGLTEDYESDAHL